MCVSLSLSLCSCVCVSLYGCVCVCVMRLLFVMSICVCVCFCVCCVTSAKQINRLRACDQWVTRISPSLSLHPPPLHFFLLLHPLLLLLFLLLLFIYLFSIALSLYASPCQFFFAFLQNSQRETRNKLKDLVKHTNITNTRWRHSITIGA